MIHYVKKYCLTVIRSFKEPLTAEPEQQEPTTSVHNYNNCLLTLHEQGDVDNGMQNLMCT